MREKRYEIRFGKWGAYFFDLRENKDLTLQEVVDLLNEYHFGKLMALGRSLIYPPPR